MVKTSESDLPADDEGEPDWLDARYEAGMAQAKALAEKAAAGGLSFEAFLPPPLSDWALAQIAAGRFCDPSELVFFMLGQIRDIERYAPELITTALSRSLHADTEGPMISSGEFEQHLKEMFERPLPPAAEWVRSRPDVKDGVDE